MAFTTFAKASAASPGVAPGASSVVSYYDFGVRLEPEADAPLAAEDVARLDAELKALLAAGARRRGTRGA